MNPSFVSKFKAITLAVMSLCLSLPALADDIVKFRTSALAYRSTDENGKWSEWSEWQKNSMPIVIRDNTIVIYSSEQQEYDVYEKKEYDDNEGAHVVRMQCIDKKGNQCVVRLIYENDSKQLYVDYSDISWVYNVELTYSSANGASATNGLSALGVSATSASTPANAAPSAATNVNDRTIEDLITYPMGLRFLPRDAVGLYGLDGMVKTQVLVGQNISWRCDTMTLSESQKYLMMIPQGGYNLQCQDVAIASANMMFGNEYYQNTWLYTFRLDKETFSLAQARDIVLGWVNTLKSSGYEPMNVAASDRLVDYLGQKGDKRVSVFMTDVESGYSVNVLVWPKWSMDSVAVAQTRTNKSTQAYIPSANDRTFEELVTYPMGLRFLPKEGEGLYGVTGADKFDQLMKQNVSWTYEIRTSTGTPVYKYVYLHDGYDICYKGHLMNSTSINFDNRVSRNYWDGWFNLSKAEYSEAQARAMIIEMANSLRSSGYEVKTDYSTTYLVEYDARKGDKRVTLNLSNDEMNKVYRISFDVYPRWRSTEVIPSATTTVNVTSSSMSTTTGSTAPSATTRSSYSEPKESVFKAANSHKWNMGLVGGAIGIGTKTMYGVGFNLTICGFYADMLFHPSAHSSDVEVDEWEDEQGFSAHIGYQVPVCRWLRVIPVVGYCDVSEGTTDGSNYSISGGEIHNSYVADWRESGFDFGGLMVLHFRAVNIYLGGTVSSAYGGVGLEF